MFFKKTKKKLKEKEEALIKEHKQLVLSKNKYDAYLVSLDSNFLSSLIHQVGDLIHYQDYDYKSNTPKNAEIYNYVGSVLRSMQKHNRNQMTVLQIIAEKSSISHIVPKDILKQIENFNAIMLVDLTCRMQGGDEDDLFLSAVKQVNDIYKI